MVSKRGYLEGMIMGSLLHSWKDWVATEQGFLRRGSHPLLSPPKL
jgi:hypothetical protein